MNTETTNGSAAKNTDTPTQGISIIAYYCTGCKEQFVQGDLQSLVSVRSKVKPLCPKCQKECTVPTREISCPSCHSPFWIADQIMGRKISCPQCRTELTLPSKIEWKSIQEKAKGLQWTVVPSGSGAARSFADADSIARAMMQGEVRNDDQCITHKWARPRKMREVCDQHFALRKLYDPIGAWVERAGNYTAAGFVLAYVLAHIISGVTAMGGTYILAGIFGILAVVLTPTGIGLFIVYVIATGCGIPLLGAYFGVLLVGLIGVAVYFVGRAIGRGVAKGWGSLSGLQDKRPVKWK